MAASRELHGFRERVRNTAGHLFVPLLALHVASAVKHALFDRRGVALRMFGPGSRGR